MAVELVISDEKRTQGAGMNQRQRRFVLALLETPTIRHAAKAAGISETTAWKYLGDAQVRGELAHRTDALIAQAGAGLLVDMAEARLVLKSIMLNSLVQPASRVSAARAILDAGLRLFELVALADRVNALEERLEADR